MARIAGIDLPREKRIDIGLSSIYGVGRVNAKDILEKAGVKPETRVKDLTDQEITKIAAVIQADYVVEGDLRRQVQMNIKRLMDIGCYR
ncbi:MAG: 30S ribosomal protein S13, partial [Candidatus Omnitrophica bacterium]|nr:30S ribosomal protein S13 [Candidatus Omnitrophota bacterium]